MVYVVAANEARATNYIKSQWVKAEAVTDVESVPELQEGDTVVVVGTLPADLKKAVWDAWRDVDGVHKRWAL